MLHDALATRSPNLTADGLTSQVCSTSLPGTCTPRWPSCTEVSRSYADLHNFSSRDENTLYPCPKSKLASTYKYQHPCQSLQE